MASASSRSASRRASRAISSSSWERTTPSVALVTVSSSRSTIWPASTSSPSLTRISPTTPPVGCCTFFTLDSTTMVPGAITAPANWVVAAQPPTPPTRSTVIANPTRLSLRIVRRGSCSVTSLASSRGAADDLEIAGRRRRRRNRRALILCMISSRGPKSFCSPLASTRMWSQTASTDGRCAISTTMAPRALRLAMAWRKATSPSLSRLEFGSSSTTRNGSPYSARASAMRWRCPPESASPPSPIGVS